MLQQAGHDTNKRKKIKAVQLLGVEKRQDMFAHACSNMMMRGDGKSHIFYGDCFNEKIKEEIKNYKPTKSFLNPPYTKDNNDEQLEFIENALECLEAGGICVAICKMGTVVADSSSVIEVKKRLLEANTLLGVFSMPVELFNPAASVPTVILVFKARQPHPKNQKSFFGYFKDDGYVVSKNKRTDSGTWHEIRDKWLNTFKNKESIVGLSVMKEVKSSDEWCAEAYLETDYSKLSKKDFIDSIKEYVAFNVKYNG